MINENDYRFNIEAELEEFLEMIPSRLDSLAKRLGDWDGNQYDFQKKNGSYSSFTLSYELIRLLEKWVLEITKKTKDLPSEQVLELCSLLGEIVVHRTSGNWKVTTNDFYPNGMENQEKLFPAIYDWSDFEHDLPFTPLFSLEHFVRNRSKNYLEMRIRYCTEHGEGRFEILDDWVNADLDEDALEVLEGILEMESEEDGLDRAMEFIYDELEFFSELLEEQGIELNMERDDLDFIIDRSFYSDEKLASIETFFHENASGIGGANRDDLAEMMSAYIAEFCAARLVGFPDYEDDELVVLWSESETDTGKLVVSELLEKIEENGAGTIASILKDCHVHPSK